MYEKEYEKLSQERMNWKTEEEVRLGWLYAIRDRLGIKFHAERGRSDADYNQVIIEFKNRGILHKRESSLKFVEALEELSRYIPPKAYKDAVDVGKYIEKSKIISVF